MLSNLHGRWSFRFGLVLMPTLIAGIFLGYPAQADQIHRNGFEGRQSSWLRGEDNVRAEERVHTLSQDYAHQGTSSEHIQLVCPEGKNDTNFATYYYPTQPAPLGEDLTANVWIKANKSGIKLQARLVLPRERNPKQLDELMTVMIQGDTYQLTRRWQRLELNNPIKLAKEQQQVLRTKLQRDVDFTDAYIDRLVLNLYTGPGQIDVYIDDLEIGPVRTVRPPQPAPPPVVKGGTPGTVTGNEKEPSNILPPPVKTDRGVMVRMEADRLTVGGQPFFFRAIRHTDVPLKTLRDAGFNTVWFDLATPQETIEEAANHGFWIVPSLPLLGDRPGTSLTSKPNDLASARDTEEMGKAIARFLSGDAVLFWDLGGALQSEKVGLVERTAKAVRQSDPHRPRGIDVWDGFSNHSPYNVELLGTHRFPLMTSLELTRYRDWLVQRRRLTLTNTLHWTWIQTHLPEWQSRMLYGHDTREGFKEPVGPQPEQIRLLTYLALANGCRGLAFYSDKFLTDSHQGRDRWLMMALLNQEIHMLEPLLVTLRDAPTWIPTSNPNVQAAVLRSEKGVLVLPVWLGDGAQFVPPQGAVTNLSMTVELVPDGSEPWEISPGRVQSLQQNARRVLRGTHITLPEFDLTAAIVFTSDLSPDGLVSRWQRHSRKMARISAQWAGDLAALELQKVRRVHAQLESLAPPIRHANQLLKDAEQYLDSSRRYERIGDDPAAYQEAVRALRPLRILMRAHWQQAVQSLDVPSASPYAVSFYTLPRHYELARQLQGTRAAANVLRQGDFEFAVKKTEIVPASFQSPEEGTRTRAGFLAGLDGWQYAQQTLDPVELEARLVPSADLKMPKAQPPAVPKGPYSPSTGRQPVQPEMPEPTLGEQVLRMQIRPQVTTTAKNKPVPPPAALERTYLAVFSPQVQLPPGSWARISGWVRIPEEIRSSADGVLIFDNVGGEALGLRLTAPQAWKKFHLYRQVPASGSLRLTLALTGIGTVYFDDLRIEALSPVEKQ